MSILLCILNNNYILSYVWRYSLTIFIAHGITHIMTSHHGRSFIKVTSFVDLLHSAASDLSLYFYSLCAHDSFLITKKIIIAMGQNLSKVLYSVCVCVCVCVCVLYA